MTKAILIVDDEGSFRFAASLSLRQEGYEVSEAQNGKEAFKMITDRQRLGRPYDLIVLDIQMPEVNGLELFGDLRKLGIATPVIFITGYADEHAMSLASHQADSNLLRKPFEAKTLVNMVDRMLGVKTAKTG